MIETLTVLDIMTEYIRENDYDGLVSEDRDCACRVTDLAPCGAIGERCQVGWICDMKHTEHDAAWGITTDAEEAREHPYTGEI